MAQITKMKNSTQDATSQVIVMQKHVESKVWNLNIPSSTSNCNGEIEEDFSLPFKLTYISMDQVSTPKLTAE